MLSTGVSPDIAIDIFRTILYIERKLIVWACQMPAAAGTTAKNSLCPKNWHLPTNSTNPTYNTLISTYSIADSSDGSVTLREAPLYFVRSGYYHYSGYVSNIGSGGYYWSSAASTTTLAYYLYFSSTNVNPQRNLNRGYGFSVRCVAP